MENKITVKQLKKSFGDLEVLKDISIEIKEGEVVCMIGPSGSGKSTFLRCLNRLEKITSGEVVVDGHPISDPNTNINKVRENIGMVFQHFNLFPHLTVRDNITLAPTQLKLMNKAEADQKALELLGRVGLSDKADVYPGQLSGGQKQRVAIARSLAMNPDIMLKMGEELKDGYTYICPEGSHLCFWDDSEHYFQALNEFISTLNQ